MHLAPLLAIMTGIHLMDIILCIVLYIVRMFFITAGYHRYFAHRSYKLGRVMQFVMALGGTMSAQKGVLWWAGHHRDHHLYSDMPQDIHSPRRGFWWSHVGWFLCDKFKTTPMDRIRDFASYPELRLLDKYPLVPPTLLAITILMLGGWSALLIGFFLSTVLLYHGTFTINSLSHVIGSRRFATSDTSRNNWFLALITLGEGWHNNHHHYRSSTRQGFYWWEIDASYYILQLLSFVRLVKETRLPPKEVLLRNRLRDGAFDIGMFEERFAKAFQALERTKIHGTAYYESKRAELDRFMKEARRTASELSRVSQHPVLD